MTELLEDDEFAPQIEALTAIPSSGGKFEITVNDNLIYSKKATGRHVEPGEIHGLIKKLLQAEAI